jgi:phosphoglucosamine mutase
LEIIVLEEKFRRVAWKEVSEVSYAEREVDEYVKALVNSFSLEKRWKVALDCGCGAASQIAPRILRELGLEVRALNSNPDGYFPARSPDPKEDTLRELCDFVRRVKADVALALDGDGDRIALIDEEGAFIGFDAALAFYASKVVGEGELIVTNVDASMVVEELVRASGGRVLRTRVGDVFISKEVSRNNAVFGGEPCGAWIHPSHVLCPDGIFSALAILKVLEREEVELSCLKEVPTYPMRREKIRCAEELKPRLMEAVLNNYSRYFEDALEVWRLDGVRIALEDGWILIRPSGTEPVVRITTEARDKQKLRDILEIGKNLVKDSMKTLRITPP